MADTTFVTGTVVQADWLNDVNDVAYGLGQTTAGKGAELVAVDDNTGGTLYTTVKGFITRLRSTLGAALVGANDGSSGTIFTTVSGFIGKLLSNTGSAIVGFVQIGAGASSRTVQDKLRERISVKDFGAIGDGVTDDTSAFSSAISAIISAGGGKLFVPKGVYRITSQLSVVCDSQQHFIIEGEGRYLSTLDFMTGSSLGIYFQSTSLVDNQLPTFEVTNLGLITSHDDAGTALKFSYANSNNIDASVTVNSILIAQNVDRVSDTGSGYGFWSNGIWLENARNSELNDLHVFGELNKTIKSSYGLYLGGESTACVVTNSLFMEWTFGAEVAGTSEGFYLSDTDVVFCTYGVRHNIASGAEPQFTVVGCSFNVSAVGVWLINSQQSVISNSLFYATSAFYTSGWPEWTGVLFQGVNSRFNKVIGCTFAKESGRTGDTTTGIDFNQGRMYTASSNHFFGFSGNPLTYGVQVRSGVSDTIVQDDCLYEYVTNPYSNAGTRSVEQQLVQGGSGSFASGATISFPQAFTRNVTAATAIHLGTNTAVNVTISSITTSGFVVNHNAGAAVLLSWIAIGK